MTSLVQLWEEFSVLLHKYSLRAWGFSLVAQMVKNLPAMQEKWGSSLGREYPLEKGMATQPGILD